MGGLWLAWLFWFCEALALCVGAKPNVPNALAKNFLCALGIFLFFSVSGCCLVRYRSVGSGGRPAIATNSKESCRPLRQLFELNETLWCIGKRSPIGTLMIDKGLYQR